MFGECKHTTCIFQHPIPSEEALQNGKSDIQTVKADLKGTSWITTAPNLAVVCLQLRQGGR